MVSEEKIVFIEDKPLLIDTEAVILESEEVQTYSLSDLKSDAKYLRLDTKFSVSEATKSNYRPKVKARVEVSYKNTDLTNDIFYIILNRDLKVSETSYKNSSQLQLKGNDIESINITITNNSTTEIELLSTTLYQSKDLSPMQLVTVLKEQTIAADVIQATSTFSDSLFTQLLQTAVMSMTTRNANLGDEVNYIRVEDWTMSFFTATLGSETEQFSITTTTAGYQTTTHYWYAVIEGPDAYKYITTVDPRSKYPDISDSDRNAFKLMVYKPSTLSKKMSIEFAENNEGYTVPTIVYGVGTSSAEGSRLGKGFTFKDQNGFYHIYEKEDGSGSVGIVMDKDGVHIVGWADQHCEYITFKDNGIKFKFAGEPEQKFEYVIDEVTEKISGYIQNSLYLTTVGYEAGTV